MSQSEPRFDIAPSRALAALTVLLTSGGAACVVASVAPLPFLFASLLPALLVAARFWRHQVIRSSRQAVVALGLDPDGRWWVWTRAGGARRVWLSKAFLHPALVLIVARSTSGRHAAAIAADSMPACRFRALRASLNVHGVVARGADDGAA